MKRFKSLYREESKEMSLDDIKKRYAKEIIAFQDGGKDLSSGAKMALYGYIGSDGLKTDDADEFDDFVMGLQMGKYKKESLDIEVDDISVGKKKKKPAGVKADEPLKGYAYNEKMKFRFKGKNPHKLKLEELEENRADCIKGLERLVKTGGIDKKDFQKGHDLYKAGKVKDLKKHIQELDTDPLEAIVATIARCDSKTFNSMYPRAKANDYLSSIVYQHRESVENTFDSIVENTMVEIELDEALSPKEKEKRLLMIKKAVEKLNRANIDKIKKQAMRDMKASGMFDDVIDESIKGGADSYYALQQAKKKAAKMGKVWSKMGEPEKEKLIDVEMKAVGYEKKPGNQMYTKIPTDSERKFADKVRAKDKEISKMSDDDKVDYFSKNPTASSGGHNISDEGKVKIQIARYQSQIDALEKRAIEAQRKAYDAEEKGDDLAFEKYQDEEEYFLDRIREVETHLQNFKDKHNIS
jgi:hypothetical protein